MPTPSRSPDAKAARTLPVSSVRSQAQQPGEHERDRQQVVQRLAAEDQMRRREDQQQRSHRWIHAAGKQPQRQRVEQRDVDDRDQHGSHANRPLGQRQHLQRQRDQIEIERLIPARAGLIFAERPLQVDEERQEPAGEIAAGGRERMRLHREVRFVSADVQRGVADAVEVETGSQSHDKDAGAASARAASLHQKRNP